MTRLKLLPDFKSGHPIGSSAWRRDYQRARRKTLAGREEMARANLKALHSLTQEQYDVMYERQRGMCAICRRSIVRAYTVDTGGKRGPKVHGATVEHDPNCCPGRKSCGRCVRGLLCHHCNAGLGMFRHSPQLMKAAIYYVDNHERALISGDQRRSPTNAPGSINSWRNA